MRMTHPGCVLGVTHEISHDGSTVTHTADLSGATFTVTVTYPDQETATRSLDDDRARFDASMTDVLRAVERGQPGTLASAELRHLADDLIARHSRRLSARRLAVGRWTVLLARSSGSPTWWQPRLWGHLHQDGRVAPTLGGGWLRHSYSVSIRPR